MRTGKVLTAAMVACLAAGTLAGRGNKKSDEKVTKVGISELTTGENGDGGYREALGICYAREMHPTVDIGGEEYIVKLVKVDNRSGKTEAVSAAQKLISERVNVVLGSYGFGVSITAGQIFVGAKTPAVDRFCTNPQVTEGNDLYSRVYFIDPFQGMIMTNYAYQNSTKNVAMITQLDDDYSSGLGSYLRDAFIKLDGSIVNEEQFQANQADFKATLANIKIADPGIILVPSPTTTTSLIIKQAREPGVTAIIAADDTWENSIIIEGAGADSEGVVLSTFFDEAKPANDEAAAFIEGFKGYLVKEKQGGIIPAVSALGCDSYLAAIKAIENAGSTNIITIRNALKNVEIDDATGNIIFNETGDANKDIAFIKTIKDGKFQFLTTTIVG